MDCARRAPILQAGICGEQHPALGERCASIVALRPLYQLEGPSLRLLALDLLNKSFVRILLREGDEWLLA